MPNPSLQDQVNDLCLTLLPLLMPKVDLRRLDAVLAEALSRSEAIGKQSATLPEHLEMLTDTICSRHAVKRP